MREECPADSREAGFDAATMSLLRGQGNIPIFQGQRKNGEAVFLKNPSGRYLRPIRHELCFPVVLLTSICCLIFLGEYGMLYPKSNDSV